MKGRVEKMRRILFGMGFFLFLYGPVSSSEAVVDRIVAVVNQEIITLSEVEKLTGPLQAGDRDRGSLGEERTSS